MSAWYDANSRVRIHMFSRENSLGFQRPKISSLNAQLSTIHLNSLKTVDTNLEASGADEWPSFSQSEAGRVVPPTFQGRLSNALSEPYRLLSTTFDASSKPFEELDSLHAKSKIQPISSLAF